MKTGFGPNKVIVLALLANLALVGITRALGCSWLIATAWLWLPSALVVLAGCVFAMLTAIIGYVDSRRY